MPITRAETKHRSRDVLAMVMTPDRIPPFTIPSLAPAEGRRSRCYSLDVGRLRDRREQLEDPVTRAAMSLPHLSKVITPYGFLTLGESPCVHRKESLFFDSLPSPPSPCGLESSPAAPCAGPMGKAGRSFSWDVSGSVRGKNRLQRLLKKHLAGKRKPEPDPLQWSPSPGSDGGWCHLPSDLEFTYSYTPRMNCEL